MVLAAPIFAYDVVALINNAIFLVTAVLLLWALIHAVVQRGDAFTAVGTLQKGAWLAILAGGLLLTVLLRGGGFGLLFTLIGLGAAMVYLFDVRRGIRDITGGRW